MAFPELRLLARFRHIGTLAAKTSWSPPPIQTTDPNLPQGLLNGKQVGEVAFCEISSPVSATGSPDALDRVQLVLDGQPYPFIWLSGRQDTSMAPPRNRLRRGRLLTYGLSFLGRNGLPNDPVQATCPKFVESVSVQAYAGGSDVTDPFTIDVWGYVYDSVDLASRVPAYVIPNIDIPDPLNGRHFTAKGRTITADGDWRGSWTSLHGGPQQGGSGGTAVHPLVRRARNANASTVSEAYVPQFQNSSQSPAVEYSSDNMYFRLNARQAILLERFGIVGPAAPNATGYDILAAWIETVAEAQKRHPAGGIPADYNRGQLRFGLVKGETNKFDGIPELPQGPQLLTDETAYPTFVDNGVSLPALSVTMALVGKFFGPPDAVI